MRAGSTRPRPATAPSSTSSRRTPSGRRSPSAPTAASAAAARSLGVCFSEAARDRAAKAELVDRQPRALLRRPRAAQPHRRAGDPARARRRRLRRGAPAGGVGRDLARRPRSAAPVIHRLAARRRPRLPRGGRARAGACARPRRGRRRCGCCASVAPESGRRRLREVPAEPAATLADAARRARRRARGRSRRARRRRRARRCDSRPTSPACLEAGRRQPRRLGRARRCSPGRRSTSARRSREMLWDDGPTAILVSATLVGGRRLRLRPRAARPARGGRARRRLALRLPRRRRSSTCRAALPDPRADDAARARRRGGRGALPDLRAAARSC